MIVDLDDFHEGNHRLPLLYALRAANPEFRCTLFAIPTLGSDEFWESVPDWCELAFHGWKHGDPPTDGGECKDWSFEEMDWLIYHHERGYHDRFVRGFKAPGWQISDGCYEALAEAGWWVADQPYNDGRRPHGLRVHRLSEGASTGDDPDHWHGHIQNVCGNGLEETFDRLLQKVKCAETFELVSEAVQLW